MEMLKSKLPPGKHHVFETRDKITPRYVMRTGFALGDAQDHVAARYDLSRLESETK